MNELTTWYVQYFDAVGNEDTCMVRAKNQKDAKEKVVGRQKKLPITFKNVTALRMEIL